MAMILEIITNINANTYNKHLGYISNGNPMTSLIVITTDLVHCSWAERKSHQVIKEVWEVDHTHYLFYYIVMVLGCDKEESLEVLEVNKEEEGERQTV